MLKPKVQGTTKTAVLLPDIHFPFHDEKVFEGAVRFIAREKPDIVGLLGDCYDWYEVSRYDKDPERLGGMGLDLGDPVKQTLGAFQKLILQPIVRAASKAWRFVLEGNHEERLRKYVWRHAPALGSLGHVSVPVLYQLGRLGFSYFTRGVMVKLGRLRVLHGHLIRKWSGASARAHFERHGTSILHAHSHRMGAFYKRDIKGVHGAWEAGCLCDLSPEYMPFPDWQQGWAVVSVGAGGLFSVELVSVVNQSFYTYGGKTYAI